MIKKIRHIFLGVSLLVLISSCSQYEKLLKSTDHEKKYAAALEYYKKKDYYRTLQLLDEVMPVYRGTEKSEQVYYHYAYSYYGQESYLMASYHFKNFSKTFPRSKYAEECSFMSAYCFYLDSPVYSLDQENTHKAISELQSYINEYPQSTRIDSCNKLIDQLRVKLEDKSFESAKLYFNTGEYKAAIVAFNNTLKDFPNTKYRELATYYIFESSFRLAMNSIEDKKNERLKSAYSAYNDFVERFPESKLRKQADGFKGTLKKEIEKRKIEL